MTWKLLVGNKKVFLVVVTVNPASFLKETAPGRDPEEGWCWRQLRCGPGCPRRGEDRRPGRGWRGIRRTGSTWSRRSWRAGWWTRRGSRDRTHPSQIGVPLMYSFLFSSVDWLFRTDKMNEESEWRKVQMKVRVNISEPPINAQLAAEKTLHCRTCRCYVWLEG